MAPEMHGRIPGRHAAGDAVITAFENARLQGQAGALAAQFSAWAAAPIGEPSPVDGASPDLIEWCRKVRDVLEVVRDA